MTVKLYTANLFYQDKQELKVIRSLDRFQVEALDQAFEENLKLGGASYRFEREDGSFFRVSLENVQYLEVTVEQQGEDPTDEVIVGASVSKDTDQDPKIQLFWANPAAYGLDPSVLEGIEGTNEPDGVAGE